MPTHLQEIQLERRQRAHILFETAERQGEETVAEQTRRVDQERDHLVGKRTPETILLGCRERRHL